MPSSSNIKIQIPKECQMPKIQKETAMIDLWISFGI
jgi:hypothetical protein